MNCRDYYRTRGKGKRLKPSRRKKKPNHTTLAWQEKRVMVFERDEWTCRGCGKVLLDERDLDSWERRQARLNFLIPTIDHIKPLSKGGANHMENLQTMCYACNQSKADEMPQEAADG